MNYRLVFLGLLLGSAPASAQSALTATEMFDLRTKCYEQGQKLLAEADKEEWKNTAGKVQAKGEITTTVQTNYDFKSNHCYAFIKNFFQPPHEGTFIRISDLYDALSKELLALKFEHKDAEKNSGYVYDKSLPLTEDERSNTIEVDKYINMRMAVSR